MTSDKVIGKLTKLVNNWCWLYTYIFVIVTKIKVLCIYVIIAMIFGSQLVLNISILDNRGCVETGSLILISEKSEFCYRMKQSLG